MIGYHNTYLSAQEIIANIPYSTFGDVFATILIGITTFLTILLINYLIPILFITNDFLLKERTKRKRKTMIKQIAMQKEIEEEIEQEL